MFEKEITINTGEGQMNTFIVHPDEDGPHPVILFLMDAPGKREELHQMARRIAAAILLAIWWSSSLFPGASIKNRITGCGPSSSG